ncbi:MAG TPA: hypothetical protein VHS59_03510, partial [Bacillota bacterium]|nr:hypothetical protein [Bacillota bacterium]
MLMTPAVHTPSGQVYDRVGGLPQRRNYTAYRSGSKLSSLTEPTNLADGASCTRQGGWRPA